MMEYVFYRLWILNGYGNTLQAIKNHEYVDPLSFPGASDLTSHINFSQIIKETNNRGMNFFGHNNTKKLFN